MRILLIVVLLISSNLFFGQFTNIRTQSVYGGLGNEWTGAYGSYPKILILKDGYVLYGHTESGLGGTKTSPAKGNSDIWILRLDTIGNVIWDRTIGTSTFEHEVNIIEVGGEFIIATYTTSGISGDKTTPSNGSYDYWLIKLDKDGNKIWDKSSGFANYNICSSIMKLGTSFFATGYWSGYIPKFGNYVESWWLRKIDFNGNIIWDSFYNSPFGGLNPFIVKGFNSFYLCGNSTNSPRNQDYTIIKIDTNGRKIWEKTIGGRLDEFLKSAIYLHDHSILLSGYSDSENGFDKSENWKGGTRNEDIWIVKIDSSGNLLWEKTIGGFGDDFLSSSIEIDKKIYLYGTSESNKSGDKSEDKLNSTDLWLVCIDSLGNKIFDKTIGGGGGLGNIYYINNRIVLTAVCGQGEKYYRTVDTIGATDYWVFSYGDSNVYKSLFKSISGKVFADLNTNCLYDNGEINLKNKIIYNHVDKNYYLTNSQDYTVYLYNTDTAKLELMNVNDTTFNHSCYSNKIQTVILKDTVKSAKLDFPIQPTKRGHCLDITSFSNSILRAGRWSSYRLEYVNNGFDTAYNASLEIIVDASLIDSIKSSTSYTLVGNKLIFQLGNILGFENRLIMYQIRLKTNVISGSSICHKALIKPYCALYTNTKYDSTKINAKTKCVGKDKIELEIKNESTFDQKEISDIYTYKDDSLANTATVKLKANELKTYTYYLDSNTVFSAKLVLNNGDPVQPIILLHDDICALSAAFKTKNSVMNFHREHDSKEYEEDCDIVRGSYDPNIKSVNPAGITSERYTNTGTELIYRVDFQNTGNDTAFKVVITDSLSEFLNIATFLPGTSSHPYQVEFDKRKVKFIFDPIALVDSTTNEPESHGYVTFKIRHNSNIKPKSKIENEASIYFDFNPPIITNKVLNTIYDVLLIATKSNSNINSSNTTPISVFPNPTTNMINIELTDPVSNLSIELVDINGKSIEKLSTKSQTHIQLNAEKLEQGIYIIRCYGADKFLTEQKIQIRR